MKKRILFLLITALLLCGCAPRTVSEMYSVPKRSLEYSQLQSAVDGAMTNLDYAAPLSGENRQMVQTADLDGDGIKEYLVFAKGASEKPLQILIFEENADREVQLREMIECNGSAFEQVEYVQIDDTPGYELVVGRQVSDQVVRSVSVYSFASGTSQQLMSTGYSRFLTCDMDEDDRKELLIIQPGEADTLFGVAMLYNYQNGVMERSLEAEMSQQPQNIKRIMVSRIYNGSPAIFVASAVDESAIITDVFAFRDGKFTNISASSDSGTSVQTLRNYFVYAEDVDSDGILELPSLITMHPLSVSQSMAEQYLIRWYAMDIGGQEVDKLYTYHNYAGGWYLQLNSLWANRVTVEQQGNICRFYVWNTDYDSVADLFTVYALTGSDRETQAAEDGRVPLYRTESVVYAARLESGAAEYGITEEILINSFRLIQQDWKSGET